MSKRLNAIAGLVIFVLMTMLAPAPVQAAPMSDRAHEMAMTDMPCHEGADTQPDKQTHDRCDQACHCPVSAGGLTAFLPDMAKAPMVYATNATLHPGDAPRLVSAMPETLKKPPRA